MAHKNRNAYGVRVDLDTSLPLCKKHLYTYVFLLHCCSFLPWETGGSGRGRVVWIREGHHREECWGVKCRLLSQSPGLAGASD